MIIANGCYPGINIRMKFEDGLHFGVPTRQGLALPLNVIWRQHLF
jgi:hypothetical protein